MDDKSAEGLMRVTSFSDPVCTWCWGSEPVFRALETHYPSTFPQNIAYEAAKLADLENNGSLPLLASRRNRSVCLSDEQARRSDKHAEKAGIGIDKFVSHLDDGSAQVDDRVKTSSAFVSGFPTFMLLYKDKAIMLNGCQSFAQYPRAIQVLTDGVIVEEKPSRTTEGLIGLHEKHPMMAIEEVRQAFDFATKDEVLGFIEPLQQLGEARIIEAENGKFIIRKGFYMAKEGSSSKSKTKRPLLTKTPKRLLDLVHILFAGLWLGGYVVMLGLSIMAYLGQIDSATATVAISTIKEMVTVCIPMLMISGLIYSIFTNWGFVRHGWVIAKWLFAIAAVICSAALPADPLCLTGVVVLMVVLFVLSVFKPHRKRS